MSIRQTIERISSRNHSRESGGKKWTQDDVTAELRNSLVPKTQLRILSDFINDDELELGHLTKQNSEVHLENKATGVI